MKDKKLKNIIKENANKIVKRITVIDRFQQKIKPMKKSNPYKLEC